MNILVVDDEQPYRFLLMTYLVELGWEAFGAENGEEALRKMERVKMDLVITDLYMPVMNGFKFHQEARNMLGYSETPFLFVSGYDDEHTRNVVNNPRIEGFIMKTRPLDDIVEWIQHHSAHAGEQFELLPPREQKKSNRTMRYFSRTHTI